MPPHRIRLRRPWRCEPSGDGACYRRGFHRPTNADGEAIFLVCEGVAADAVVGLNGVRLGAISTAAAAPWRCDVTGRLMPQNELALELAAEPPVGNAELPWRDVRLEIEPSA